MRSEFLHILVTMGILLLCGCGYTMLKEERSPPPDTLAATFDSLTDGLCQSWSGNSVYKSLGSEWSDSVHRLAVFPDGSLSVKCSRGLSSGRWSLETEGGISKEFRISFEKPLYLSGGYHFTLTHSTLDLFLERGQWMCRFF